MAILLALCLAALAPPSIGGAAVSPVLARSEAVLPAAGGNLGTSAALSGDTAVVGAMLDDGGVPVSGAAYVFVRSGGAWVQEAKLVASDAASADLFGASTAIDGDTIVVGASGDDDAGGASGSAYVFTRSGGVWTEQAKLTATDAAEGDFFGESVGVSGDTIVAGAFYDQDAGFASGSAYVFERAGSVWTETAKLTPSDHEADDYFGYRVAIDEDRVLAGAPENDDAGSQSGSAYVFVRAGGTWSEEAKLTASNASAESFFGSSLALSGDTAIVGTLRLFGAPGSAYVFVRAGASWTEQAALVGPGVEADGFGTATLAGDTALVGAAHSTIAGTNAGALYLFGRDGATWGLQATLVATDAAAGDSFGFAVALDGTTALVGAPGQLGTPEGGAAYAYELAPGSNVGGALAIKNALPDHPRRNRLRFVAAAPSVVPAAAGTAGDPRCDAGGGGALVVRSATSGQTFSQALPCARWRPVGDPSTPKAWDYRDPDRLDGPCTRAFVRAGKLGVKCSSRDASPLAYDLQVGQTEAPATLLLDVGNASYCARLGGTIKHDGSSGKTFDARRAPTTTACE